MKPYFGSKLGSIPSTITSFVLRLTYCDHKKSFSQNVSNRWKKRSWIFSDDSPIPLGDIERKREGVKIALPQKGAWLERWGWNFHAIGSAISVMSKYLPWITDPRDRDSCVDCIFTTYLSPHCKKKHQYEPPGQVRSIVPFFIDMVPILQELLGYDRSDNK